MSPKHLRPQCQPSSVIQHLSIPGGSPYVQLNIDPRLFTSFSASNGQRHHSRGSRRNKGQHDGVLERELNQMVDQEKIPRLQQEAVGNLREPADRTAQAETREPGSPCDTERVVFGRKRRKSKREIV